MPSRLLLVLLGVALGALPRSSQARPKPPPPALASHQADTPQRETWVVEVSVLHATKTKRGVDARIGDVPELKEAPFASYTSYELLSRNQLLLGRGRAPQLTLPNGRLLEARWQGVLPDGRVRLVASINRPGRADFLPLLEVKARPGQSFIVAGQGYQGGILVLVFKLLR